MTKAMIVGGYELSDEEEGVATPPPKMPIASPKPSAFKFPRSPPTHPANTANKSNASVKPGGRTSLPTPRQTPNETRSAWDNLAQELETSDANLSSPVKQVQGKQTRASESSHEATITRLEKENASLRENRNTQSERIDRLNDSLTAYTTCLVQLELSLHTLQTAQLQASQAVPPFGPLASHPTLPSLQNVQSFVPVSGGAVLPAIVAAYRRRVGREAQDSNGKSTSGGRSTIHSMA
ncbi:hypothetical protein FRC12_015820 [Ceratobasidium sp. 428]|nr:hypothetical protein FRC12_015820 [Ceratobasidium sp. 428]